MPHYVDLGIMSIYVRTHTDLSAILRTIFTRPNTFVKHLRHPVSNVFQHLGHYFNWLKVLCMSRWAALLGLAAARTAICLTGQVSGHLLGDGVCAAALASLEDVVARLRADVVVLVSLADCDGARGLFPSATVTWARKLLSARREGGGVLLFRVSVEFCSEFFFRVPNNSDTLKRNEYTIRRL